MAVPLAHHSVQGGAWAAHARSAHQLPSVGEAEAAHLAVHIYYNSVFPRIGKAFQLV